MEVDVVIEIRVTALETEMKFVRRDLDEVRTDVRKIQERISSIDVTLGAMSEKLGSMSELLNRFPTKLQLTLWACAGLTALLGVCTSMVALVLRLVGHHDAAAVVDAVSGG
jgi:tetrahydromethanopterin S-methyltransferase subunit B